MTPHYNYPLCFFTLKDDSKKLKDMAIAYYKTHISKECNASELQAFLTIIKMNGARIDACTITDEDINTNTQIWNCDELKQKYMYISDNHCLACTINPDNCNKNKTNEEFVIAYLLNNPGTFEQMDKGVISESIFKSKVIYFENNELRFMPAIKEIYALLFQEFTDTKNTLTKEKLLHELKKKNMDEKKIKILEDYYDSLISIKVEFTDFSFYLNTLKSPYKKVKKPVLADNSSESMHILTIPNLQPAPENKPVIFSEINNFINISKVSSIIEIERSNIVENKESSNSNEANTDRSIVIDTKERTDNYVVLNSVLEFDSIKSKILTANIIHLCIEKEYLLIHIKTKKKYEYFKLPNINNYKKELLWLLKIYKVPIIINSVKPFYDVLKPEVPMINSLTNLNIRDDVLKNKFSAIRMLETFKDNYDSYKGLEFSKIINTYEKQERYFKKESLIERMEEALEGYRLLTYSCSIKPKKYALVISIKNSVSEAVYKDNPFECGSWHFLVTAVLISVLKSKLSMYTDIHIHEITDNGLSLSCDDEYLNMLSDNINHAYVRFFKYMIDTDKEAKLSWDKITL